MGNKLYVGNLSYSTNDTSLAELFAQAGTVQSANVITESQSGRSKGFGFVEMSTDEEAKAAIEKLNGFEHDGRAITVAEARPKTERSSNGGGGGYGGGSRGGSRGGSSNRRW